MSVGLRGDVVGSDNLDEDFFEVLLGVFFAKPCQGALGKKLAVMNNADGVAELFDFAHDVGGKDDGLADVAAFADESGDGASGHDVEAVGGFVEDHHRGVVDESAGDGGFLLHAGGKLVAAAVAEAAHGQAVEDIVDTPFWSSVVENTEM